MKTADYALIVSIFSACVAIASFGWNVWSKWLYPKAKLRVGFGAVVIHYGNGPTDQQPRYLRMAMTNFGPTETTVTTAVLKLAPKRFGQKGQHAIVNPITSLRTPYLSGGPFAGGLPKKLAVGESFDLFFPYESEFARERLTRLGVMDVFDRFHGAPLSNIKKTRKELLEDDAKMSVDDDQAVDFGAN